jgi:thioredoxin 1
MLVWLKANAMTIFLAVLALWVLAKAQGWFAPPLADDPSSPLRRFDGATWQREVLGSDKPVLVDFWAAWCGPCRVQGPIVSELAKQVSGTAVVGKLDVTHEGQLASDYGISGIPALLIFRHGKVVKRFVGVTSGSTLKAALDEAAR